MNESSKKTIYVCGSFKDLEHSKSVASSLRALGATVLLSEPGDPEGIAGCLARIERADVIYVSNPRGDVGKSVSFDVGYALAKRKPVFSMSPIADPPISAWVPTAADGAALIAALREQRPTSGPERG